MQDRDKTILQSISGENKWFRKRIFSFQLNAGISTKSDILLKHADLNKFTETVCIKYR